MSIIQSDPLPPYPFTMVAPEGYQTTDKKVTVHTSDDYDNYIQQGYTIEQTGGSRRRRRSHSKSSRKYKKSKRVFRKKSRSTRRR